MGRMQERATLRLGPAHQANLTRPDILIRSHPVIGVRLPGRAASGRRGSSTWTPPVTARPSRAEFAPRRQRAGPEYLYPAGGPENAVSARPR